MKIFSLFALFVRVIKVLEVEIKFHLEIHKGRGHIWDQYIELREVLKWIFWM
jgi:hypothetical protein